MSGDQTIGTAGEDAVLEVLARTFPQLGPVALGPGDDAAVLRTPDSRVVATTDLLVEGRHFRRNWSTAYDIGRKAAAQNLADIAAMGARPTALLVGLAAPLDLPMADVAALAQGLQDECALVGASVIGGDLVRDDHLTVAVTALGDLDGHAPVLRSGACPGDRVVANGRLGWSAAGYALLCAGQGSPPELLEWHRRPSPPYAEGPAIARAGATSLCDVSDGLLRDLGHIAAASGVAIDLNLAALVPDAFVAAAAAALSVDPMVWMLTGGEDHALIATLPADVLVPNAWRVIGIVTDNSPVGRVSAEGYADLPPGWDSFAS